MVYIGKAMFLRHRCNHEISAELATRNVTVHGLHLILI